MSRRILINRMLIGFGALMASPFSFLKENYAIKFTVDLNDFNSIAHFYEEQGQFEDNKGIESLNNIYKKKGKLFNVSYRESESQLEWVYQFKNEEAFHEWEQALYKMKLVNPVDRPYKIKRERTFILV